MFERGEQAITHFRGCRGHSNHAHLVRYKT
jgi:hypothetical protein